MGLFEEELRADLRYPKGYVTFQFTSDGSLNNEDYDPWAEGGDVTSGVVSCWTRTGQQVDFAIGASATIRSAFRHSNTFEECTE